MKTVDVLEESKKNHIIEQLHKLDYYETDNKSYSELKHKLAVFRAMEVKADNPENGWF